jgi:CheY-like chemotaxis protein
LTDAKTVLLVDDDDDVRLVCELSLRKLGGYRVVTARSGAEALERAAETPPDVILMDVVMPEMTGLETLQALRARPSTQAIPVVLMSARHFDAAPPGAAGVLSKPIDPMALPEQLAALLQRM